MTVVLSIVIVALLICLWMSRRAFAQARTEGQAVAARQLEAHRRELAALRSRADHSLNAMGEGVLILDGDGRVTFANDALRELFHLDEAVQGRTLMEALRIHQLGEMLARSAQSDRIISEEIELPRIGGTARHFDASCARLDREAQSQAAIFVLHDITPLKQIEKTRADFVANVSHELRTPLSIIKGYSETLAGDPSDPASTAKFAGIIEKHADRLTALVEDLLTISGLESGRLSIERQRLGIAPLIGRVFEELAGKAGARSVTLSSSVSPDVSLFADAGRMHQVLANLIENAINYGRENGSISVSAIVNGVETTLAVSDDGPGIPLEARERIFERFYRLDKARSRERGGTGLGLSIVKHIALAHGGRAWVDEAPGGGARFCISIPHPVESSVT